MSKKFFSGCTGCLGVFVIVVAIAGVLAWLFVARPVMNGLETFREIHQTNERIENRASYDPPATGELTRSQVERFVAVQRSISEEMKQRLEELEQKYEQVHNQWDQRDPTVREALGVWRDLGQLYADAKTTQVEALNEQGFSLEEYRFVRHSFYQAFGYDLIPYNLDSIAQAASEGDVGVGMDFEQFRAEQSQISEETLANNRELVAEYADGAEDWLAFAWWGL